MKLRLYVILLGLIVSGCYSQNLDVLRPVQVSTYTVTIPPGNHQLIGALKKEFAKAGWMATIKPSPFKVVVQYSQWDICFNFEPALHYQLTLVDMARKEEIIAMSGGGCPSGIAKDFVKAVVQSTVQVKKEKKKKKKKKKFLKSI
jgi:hypothetical protein